MRRKFLHTLPILYLACIAHADPPRLPHLPLGEPVANTIGGRRLAMDDESPNTPIAVGTLLLPRPGSPSLPNLLVVQHKNALHLFDTAANKPLSTPQVFNDDRTVKTENGLGLPSDKPARFLGATDNLAVLIQDDKCLAINLKNPAIAWKNDAPATTVALTPAKVLLFDAKNIWSLDLATGKPAWTSPNSTATFIGVHSKYIAVRTESPSRVLLLDEATGETVKNIPLDSKIRFAALAPDGTIVLHLWDSLTAWSPDPAHDKPLWTVNNFSTKFPAATLVTPDAVIVVLKGDEPTAFSLKNGEFLWPKPADNVRLSPPGRDAQNNPRLESKLHDDKAIFMSPDTLEGFFIAPAAIDRVAWRAQVPKDLIPPLDSFQLSDNYIVVLATGPMHSVRNAVNLLFYDEAGARMRLRKPIVSGGKGNPSEGPKIAAWQLLDNAVVLEVNGVIYAYRAKKP